MNRPIVLATLVVTTVLIVGVIDIVSALRVERIRREFQAEIDRIETDHDVYTAQLGRLEWHVGVVDGLARETYGTLKRHKGHALPATERETPTPRFR